ncbi:MAG: ABC1 kinase family protein [Labedaea sp.]
MTYLLLALLGVVLFVISVWVIVIGARRVLGVRVGAVRAVFASFLSWTVAGLVGRSIPQPPAGEQYKFLLFVVPFAGGTLVLAMGVLLVLEVVRPTGTGFGVLGLWRAVHGRIARTRRYSRILGIMVRHGLGGYLRDRRTRSAAIPQRRGLARSLRMALEDGGVTFVKLGQVLSTRPDLLPSEFIDELSRLQDRAAPVPIEQIEAVIRAELGATPDEVFAEFDPTPLASASVAQVHRARLRSGVDAVVKIQRPDVRPVVERDLDIIGRLASTLQTRTSWARGLDVVGLADGFGATVLEELDFRIEARNITAVAAVSGGYADGAPVRLPRVHENLCTERVLVMDRLDGVPLGASTEVIEERRLDRAGLARGLLHFLLRQVMDHGLFHADPHPGNVLLLTDGRLGMLDFGSVGRLDTGLRTGLSNLLLAIDRGDPAGLRDGLLEVVLRPDEIDEQRLERALGAYMAKHLASGSAPDVEMFTDLLRLVAAFGLAIPPAVAAVFRALATMEGTLARLAPGFNIVLESRAFAAGRITEAFEPASLRQTATRELMALLPVLRRLPRRIDRITGAIEEGRLSVNVRLLADERDRRVITEIVHQVLLALIGATTGIMAVLLLGTNGGPRFLGEITLYQILGYNLLLVSAMVGLRLLFAVFRTERGG